MTYRAGLNFLNTGNNYLGELYFSEDDNGNPPPQAPDRFLMQENGFFLLTEAGGKIQLES